jgi:hypothetical protein
MGLTLFVLSTATLADFQHMSQAESTRAQVARRQMRKSQPVPVNRAAPDMTATIPSDTRPPVPDDESIPKPFNFPIVPRARVRTCGEKWQVIKMSGRAGDQTWRDFATKCLVENNSPDSSVR